MRLPWDEWEANNGDIEKVAEKFIFANCYNSQFVASVLQKQGEDEEEAQCLSESQNPQGFVEKEVLTNLLKNL
ncbi:hypothetical protein [Nostoc sp. UHCC 0251]|uniref:hypothetical protein n=1 Tax=Nostoc sp. UHCC 0251 TaxID=3110240 RepID=UPI002B22017D|nr:hypothetical protein [Nostoc sp. UHCC 0251]MEA5623172.1 hypothetical protein [Nostoc sp. UHCC 0251]